ncbi:MAG: hypothetical protein KC620_19550, partial [Myxococcales bacterium]|nr:hypothetical protein [Myxococcales bacterium]
DLVHAFDAVPGSATTSTEQALRRSLPLGTFEQPAVFLATRPSGGGTTYAYTTYESRTTYPDGRVEEHTCRVCTPVATNAN